MSSQNVSKPQWLPLEQPNPNVDLNIKISKQVNIKYQFAWMCKKENSVAPTYERVWEGDDDKCTWYHFCEELERRFLNLRRGKRLYTNEGALVALWLNDFQSHTRFTKSVFNDDKWMEQHIVLPTQRFDNDSIKSKGCLVVLKVLYEQRHRWCLNRSHGRITWLYQFLSGYGSVSTEEQVKKPNKLETKQESDKDEIELFVTQNSIEPVLKLQRDWSYMDRKDHDNHKGLSSGIDDLYRKRSAQFTRNAIFGASKDSSTGYRSKTRTSTGRPCAKLNPRRPPRVSLKELRPVSILTPNLVSDEVLSEIIVWTDETTNIEYVMLSSLMIYLPVLDPSIIKWRP